METNRQRISSCEIKQRQNRDRKHKKDIYSLHYKRFKRYSNLFSTIMICRIFILLIVYLNYNVVEASSPSSSPTHSKFIPSNFQDKSPKPTSTLPSDPLSASTSSFSTPTQVVQTYWTAFINISYVMQIIKADNTTRHTFHTDRTETGRYAANQVYRDVRGVAVEMLSKKPKLGSDNKSVDTSSSNEDADITGCFPPFEDNYPHNEPWIAVVKRGHCTFNEKIKHAMELNASGVLVYDTENGKTLQSMKGKNTRKIPEFFYFHIKYGIYNH